MFWTIVNEADDPFGIFNTQRDDFLEAIQVAIQADRAEAEAREEFEDADWEQGEVPFDIEDFVDSWYAMYAATAVGAKGVENAQFEHVMGIAEEYRPATPPPDERDAEEKEADTEAEHMTIEPSDHRKYGVQKKDHDAPGT